MSFDATLPAIPVARAEPVRLPYPRLLLAVLIALVAGATALVVILSSTGLRLSDTFLPPAMLALMIAGVAGFSVRRRHPWRIVDASLLTAVKMLSMMICALVACTGLRLRWRVADELLASGDALLGIDVAAVTHAVAAMPLLSDLLYVMYTASGVLCVLAIGWHLVRGDRLRSWQVAGTLFLAMQATAIISIFLPARGAAAYLGLHTLQGSGLPHGAGTYAVGVFEHFYVGEELLVRLEHLNGVVCFPSFHTVVALTIVQAFAASPFRWPAVVIGALTILSTIPMGGHFATDLVGGLLVWLLAAWAATCLTKETTAQA